ncbi:MAG: cadherin-like domain-containing protein [Verrucomicrobiaceae bacterium]|nr:cadherin-like domain-containing protein [Verrucomicrobiaceae bacterium]
MKSILNNIICFAGVLLLATSTHADPLYEVKATFSASPGNSASGLVKLPDGKLYGIAPVGGEGGGGCVFKVDGPTVTAVASFAEIGIAQSGYATIQRLQVHGSSIYGLISDNLSKSYLWSWSEADGLSLLTELDSMVIGYNPLQQVVVSADGATIYGACGSGTASSGGTIWKWTEVGGLEKMLEFDGVETTFSVSIAGIVGSTADTVYGITKRETLFDPDTFQPTGYGPARLWKWNEVDGLTVLGTVDIIGLEPNGNLAISPSGAVFGISLEEYGNYTTRPVKLWKWASPATSATVVHSFAGAGDNTAEMVFDSTGNLFGITESSGQLWKLATAGGLPVVQATLPPTAGKYPNGNLYRDSTTGQIFGLTLFKTGAPSHEGAVWKWTPSPSAITIQTTLSGWGPLGGEPRATVVDAAGLVYGLSVNNAEDTLLWRANGSTISQLALLPYATYGGTYEDCQLLLDSSGNIYGVTSEDPAATTDGALWKWTASTGVVSKVASLGTAAVPGNPTGTFVRDNAGNFYGISVSYLSSGYYYGGGTARYILWRVSSTGVATNLGAIDPSAIGRDMLTNLVIDGSTVYGVCRSSGTDLAPAGAVIWKWTAAGGIELVVALPSDTLFYARGIMKHSDGNMYFVTDDSTEDQLEIWSWDMNPGNLPVFAGEQIKAIVGDANYGNIAMMEGPDGFIYGTSIGQGAEGRGVLWSFDVTMQNFDVLHAFGGTSGTAPPFQAFGFDSEGSIRGAARDVVWRYGEAAPNGSTLPVISNVSASSVAAVSANLSGTVDPKGDATNVWLEFGPSAANTPFRVTTSPASISGASPATAATVTLTGLAPNTTFFYRFAAQNVHGVAYSPTQSFKTLVATPPVVVTSPVVLANISPTTATLGGTVNPRGASVSVFCDFGLSATALTNTLTLSSPVTGSTVVPVSFSATGLAPHTRYYYRMRASGSMGSTTGAVLNFMSGNNAPTGVADTAVALPSAQITINVCANDTDPDGDALTVFSFVTSSPATQGTVTKSGGSLIFKPSATFTGPFNLTYIATDATGAKSAATSVQITKGTCTPASTSLDFPAGRELDLPAVSGLSPAGLTAMNFKVIFPLEVTANAPFAVVESLTWLLAIVNVDVAQSISEVVLSVDQNAGVAPRSGTILIGGVPVTVNQAGVAAPSLDTTSLDSGGQIGAPYLGLVVVNNSPATLSVTGTLPPGLKFYPASGVVAGVPTQAGSWTVTFKAVNAALPAGTTEPFTFTIAALPDGVAGAYAALVERSSRVNADLGARVTCNITPAGALTGSLTVDGAALPFSGTINPAFDPANSAAGGFFEVKRVGKPSYFLRLLINDPGVIAGSMFVDLISSAAISGHRLATAPNLVPFATRYVSTISLEAGSEGPGKPEGTGYLTMVSSTAGVVTLGGKLQDGTAITGSTVLGVHPTASSSAEVLVHVPLYTGTGSFEAVIDLTPAAPDPIGVQSTASTWLKKPQPLTTRPYRSGFAVSTTVTGWQWKTPATGTNVLGIAAAPDNVELNISGGEVEFAQQFGALNRTFAMSNANACTFGAAALNPTNLVLTITPTTGQFTGSFKLTDPDGYLPSKTIIRTVNFEGVIVPGVNGPFGSGFFLLSKLQADADHPALPANPATATSQLSGLIQFGEPDPGLE